MKKAIIAAVIAALACTALAGAGSKPRVVHRMCVGVQHGNAPSRYDLNLYGKYSRVCIVGRRGKNGKDGLNGQKGLPGERGETGAKGDTGATGAAGAQGEQGPAGAQGPAGPAGPAGPQGETGATGPAGPQGEQGPPGPAGEPLGLIYICASPGNNAKVVEDPSECDPGHDTIYKVDGVRIQPPPAS